MLETRREHLRQADDTARLQKEIRTANATPQEKSLHQNVVAAYDGLQRSMVKLFFYLGLVEESRAYKSFDCGTMAEYTRRVTGLPDRRVGEILTLSRRMRMSPSLAAAVESGVLTWRKALLISQFTLVEDPRIMIELAKNLSIDGLRKELRRLRGDSLQGSLEPIRPAVPEASGMIEASGSPSPGGCNRHQTTRNAEPETVAKRVVTGETGAPERNACSPVVAETQEPADETPVARPRKRKNRHLVDGSAGQNGAEYVTIRFSSEQYIRWQALVSERGEALVERILGALADGSEAEEPGLIVLLHCPGCGVTTAPTAHGEIPVTRALLETARCDSATEDERGHRRNAIPPSVRRRVLQRARYTCEARDCRNTRWLDLHHRRPVGQGGRNEVDNLIVLCRTCHLKLHRREEALRDANKKGRPSGERPVDERVRFD